MNRENLPEEGAVGTPATNACPRCGKPFTCGMAAGEAVCWCVAHPPLFAVPTAGAADAACYCPDCLAELVAQRRQQAPVGTS